MIYISNAFSPQMLGGKSGLINPVSRDEARETIAGKPVKSIIGHADVCSIINEQLGTHFEKNRESIILGRDDVLVIGQYIGQRLPEGTNHLPEGAHIEFFIAILY